MQLPVVKIVRQIGVPTLFFAFSRIAQWAQRYFGQIYAAASDIEAAHAKAGFILARVAVPPQDLHDGGALRIVLIDGFIEQYPH